MQKKNKKTKLENIFPSWVNCILKYWYKLYLFRRKYLLLALSGLTNSPKILNITQRDFFKLNCCHRDQKIWERCFYFAFNSVSGRLTCYLSKGLLKRDFLDIDLTTFFKVRYFENTSAMRVIFSLKKFKFKTESKFQKCKKKTKKQK